MIGTSVSPDGARPHALVVEDSDDLRVLLCTMLQELGFRVSAAADGEEGLTALVTLGPFALLLTDVNMPGELDGVALAMRARDLDRGMRIVVMTGYGGDALAALPPDIPLLRKPFRAGDLFEYLTAPYPNGTV